MEDGKIEADVADGRLVITVTPGPGVRSSSGKTLVVASTRGAIDVTLPDGRQAKANINIYTR